MIDTGAGVIDADYRGEVRVLLFNHSDTDFSGHHQNFCPNTEDLLGILLIVNEGDRVAQLIIEKIQMSELLEVTVSSRSTLFEHSHGPMSRIWTKPYVARMDLDLLADMIRCEHAASFTITVTHGQSSCVSIELYLITAPGSHGDQPNRGLFSIN